MPLPSQPVDDESIVTIEPLLPFDDLTARRIVELQVDPGTREVRLIADGGGRLHPVASPGGTLYLGTTALELVLELLRMVSGCRFVRAPKPAAYGEVWVRSDYARRNQTSL